MFASVVLFIHLYNATNRKYSRCCNTPSHSSRSKAMDSPTCNALSDIFPR